jgi:hypothetical protein
MWGAPGTIYLKGNTQTFGQVIVDNGGRSGAKSDLTQLGSTVDLVVSGWSDASGAEPDFE